MVAKTLLLSLPIEKYEIKKYDDTYTLVIKHKELNGEPEYTINYDGVVIELKDGLIQMIEIYDPEIRKLFEEEGYIQLIEEDSI